MARKVKWRRADATLGWVRGTARRFVARGHESITQEPDGTWRTMIYVYSKTYRTLYGAKAAAEAERRRRVRVAKVWEMWLGRIASFDEPVVAASPGLLDGDG